MNDWTNLAEAARLGGWVIYPLTVLAIVALAITLDRAYAFWRFARMPEMASSELRRRTNLIGSRKTNRCDPARRNDGGPDYQVSPKTFARLRNLTHLYNILLSIEQYKPCMALAFGNAGARECAAGERTTTRDGRPRERTSSAPALSSFAAGGGA